jgi:hypothetical protein
LCYIEKQLEDEENAEKGIKVDDKKKAAFKDEDAYDSEEERKKQKEKLRLEEEEKRNAPKKVKGSKVDYDKLYAERNKVSDSKQKQIDEIQNNPKLSAAAK